ncbi:MAG: hypothetical protein A3I77_07795 [Gammaproteobacteria bacterium RIFCSPLOWO2_02_FULL_42_14]|nr:MAG: hypothetical protein A3B71_03625 [Gammaproteobacteria bacterium RIFCSPHIGHO2_02_FULL_42_43]OGT28865.1 MAG: hypothetical protein A2624_06565 [Gammaproteobacteria bacterium RIFCSPHIGHO2_01_FULL_42_8]OGT52983.1 MAG: hypothetical protein A3E54_07900 [Gammaproteobacteria bacterium RIFCSPHIGHO2_12_FULL_41_25]OGT61245.1 MAG: hypothetical protein A3I77_07795 [Gammaproteobacteria bacterium RIFCSPLOWO2_02_FULL_42_14]OGT87172.1 MAG: hypothetical protein A3G86_01515 [Gammaproteobacteria bacterium R
MRNWQELNSLFCNYRELRIDCSDTIRKSLNELHHFGFETVSKILISNFNDEDIEKRLRLFLTSYWKLTSHTDADYTFNPKFPLNRALFLIAKNIVKKIESVCSVLMPSVIDVIGVASAAETLKEITEDDSPFSLENYLINSDGDKLISIADVLEYSKNNSVYWYGEQFQLSERDRYHISISAGPMSEALVLRIEMNELMKQGKKPSVGTWLEYLKEALRISSELEKGNAYEADFSEAIPVIQRFHQRWKTLPEPIKNKVKRLTVHGATMPLESFLLCLFSRSHIDLLPAEMERVIEENLVPCTHLIFQQIETIINENIHFLFSECALDEVVPEQPTLDFSRFSEHRQSIPGFQNEKLRYQLASYCRFSNYHLSDVLYQARVELNALQIKNLTDFIYALRFIPQEYWRFMVSKITAQAAHIFYEPSELNDQPPVIYRILTGISELQWLHFFNVFNGFLKYWFYADQLPILFTMFDFSRLKLFYTTILPYVDQLIFSGERIAVLFRWIPTEYRKDFVEIFSIPIKKVLLHVEQFVSCLSVLMQYKIHYSLLLELCWPQLQSHLNENENENSLFSLLQKFPDQGFSIQFLEEIFHRNPSPSFTLQLFVQLLAYYPVQLYSELFDAIPTLFILKTLTSANKLPELLDSLQNDVARSVFVVLLSRTIRFNDVKALFMYTLLVKYQNWEDALLIIFSPSLKEAMTTLMIYIVSHTELGFSAPIFPQADVLFDYFCKKALPLLLSMSYFYQHFATFEKYAINRSEVNELDAGYLLYTGLKKIEHETPPEDRGDPSKIFSKISLINEFLLSQKHVTVFRRSAFHRELTMHFSDGFFPALLSLYEKRFFSSLTNVHQLPSLFGVHRARIAITATREMAVVNIAPNTL